MFVFPNLRDQISTVFIQCWEKTGPVTPQFPALQIQYPWRTIGFAFCMLGKDSHKLSDVRWSYDRENENENIESGMTTSDNHISLNYEHRQ